MNGYRRAELIARIEMMAAAHAKKLEALALEKIAHLRAGDAR